MIVAVQKDVCPRQPCCGGCVSIWVGDAEDVGHLHLAEAHLSYITTEYANKVYEVYKT